MVIELSAQPLPTDYDSQHIKITALLLAIQFFLQLVSYFDGHTTLKK